ncbi:protein takeout-like isoform X2 [Periplaneta americana]|uniref:protein takeout-like isoform X2 n=1 Tax=Periplaneta americana TaxID=6978 RepID=UPI0037E8FF37
MLQNTTYIHPPYLTPCARSDPNFNACALQSGKKAVASVIKGDRKYNVPPLNPLRIKEIKVTDGGGQRVGLTLILKDADIFGMMDSDIRKTDFDFKNQTVSYEMFLPRAEVLGKYEVNGRILILPINGNGDINITMVNSKVTYDHDFTIEPKNGNNYMVQKNPRASVFPERAYFHMTNLFNGDKTLGKQMNIFLDENWKDVFTELSPAIFTAFTEMITTIISGIASSVPYEVAFPEKLP